MKGQIGELDLPDRLAPVLPRWATMLGVGLLAAGAGGIMRLAFDLVAPGSAPFSLVFPVIMVATLFARWPAGCVAALIALTYAWQRVYTPALARVDGNDRLAVLAVAIAAAALTITMAEAFRRAVRRAAAERDRQIEMRELLLAEFDHRLTNNFAIIGGMLDMQRRRAGDAAAAAALGVASGRIDSIARAHRHLYRHGASDTVEIGPYIRELCDALRDALLLQDGVTLTCRADSAAVPRDRAVLIGLIINELVTNAAKHAFQGREGGAIDIALIHRAEGGWILTVSDDGVGTPKTKSAQGGGGLGKKLIDKFAQQAGGTLKTVSDGRGTRVTLTLMR